MLISWCLHLVTNLQRLCERTTYRTALHQQQPGSRSALPWDDNRQIFSPPSASSLALGLPDSVVLDVITRDSGDGGAGQSRSAGGLLQCRIRTLVRRHAGPDGRQTLVELYGAADSVRFMPFVERVLSGERMEYQRLLHNPYGAEEWRTICLTPTRNTRGEIVGFITCAIDVHEAAGHHECPAGRQPAAVLAHGQQPLAVLEMDQELRLLHCSERAVQLMAGRRSHRCTDAICPSCCRRRMRV